MKFKYRRFQKEIILRCVRWYLAYPLSLRQLEEMMQERGLTIDHSTINRWVLKYSPLLEAEFQKRRRPVLGSWRLDETYIKVKGTWKYLYRAVDKNSHTIDCLLTAKRDKAAARRFMHKAKRTLLYLKRLILIKVAAIKRPSKVIMSSMAQILSVVRASISII